MKKIIRVILMMAIITMMIGTTFALAATDEFQYKGTATPSVSAKSSSIGANSGVYIPSWIFVLTGIAFVACIVIFVKVVLGRKKRNKKENDEKAESIREE